MTADDARQILAKNKGKVLFESSVRHLDDKIQKAAQECKGFIETGSCFVTDDQKTCEVAEMVTWFPFCFKLTPTGKKIVEYYRGQGFKVKAYKIAPDIKIQWK